MRVGWHRTRGADVALRVAGLILCWAAYAIFGRLMALPVAFRASGVAAYALALAGFVGASAGSALALYGKHLFDEIEVSARWRHRGE